MNWLATTICEKNRISGRYNVGYRHWIESCLRHGAKLYIGILDEEALNAISDVESYLIDTYPSEMNARKLKPMELDIVHEGDMPVTITSGKQTLGQQ